MSRKCELNSTQLGKRKKSRSKKLPTNQQRTQNWIDSTSQQDLIYDHCNGSVGGHNCSQQAPAHVWHHQPAFMSNHQQRLYPAMSDSSVCNYPGAGGGSLPPLRYRIEPTMSLPLYHHMYQPWQNNQMYHHHIRPKPKPATSSDSVYSSTKNNDSVHNQDFTSLPPVIDRLVVEDNDNKRRFSDPGIGPGLFDRNRSGMGDCIGAGDASDVSSGHSSVLTVDNGKDNNNGILYSLIEQVNALKESNRRLFRELHETRSELSALKQQTANWSRRERLSEYEPGSLTDIIREVRDAAKVREDALINKVRHMIEEKNYNRSYFSSSVNNSKEIDDLKTQLQETILEKERNRNRLLKLEDELRNLKINASSSRSLVESTTVGGGSSNDTNLDSDAQDATQVLEMEQETLQIRRELQEAVDGRKEAEARNLLYKRQISDLQLRRKSSSETSSLIDNEKPSTNPFDNHFQMIVRSPGAAGGGNKLDPKQHTTSLTAGVQYETASPLQHNVTLTGPVTDL